MITRGVSFGTTTWHGSPAAAAYAAAAAPALPADGTASSRAPSSHARETAAAIPRLFCRNERVVCWFDTGYGPLVVVFVGALNVSSISTFAAGEIASGDARHWHEDPPRAVEQGQEIGRFNMGSTIVVLLGAPGFEFSASAVDGAAVRMGQAVGAFATARP